LQSSDATIPSAGTDVAYIGAHQAGYARKPHAAAAAGQPVHVKTAYPHGTVASPIKAAHAVKAAHAAHRQAAAAAAAASVPAAKPAAPVVRSARGMPESSDSEVPEMGTNVVFEGASAVSPRQPPPRVPSRTTESEVDGEGVMLHWGRRKRGDRPPGARRHPPPRFALRIVR
jgi:hypothetical protein